VSKETYYRTKRDLLTQAYLDVDTCHKRPIMHAKETYYASKRDLQTQAYLFALAPIKALAVYHRALGAVPKKGLGFRV
jgi:hypothetical protein